MEKVVIIGGGIAGLTCLNALLDNGISPLLLEATTIGSPKMCGEFLAPQTAAFLRNWDIGPIQSIQQAVFFSKNKTLDIHFREPAGAFARSEIEYLLAQRARQKGGRIRERSPIERVVPATANSPYSFYLASGEEIQADTAIFATGRYGQQSNVTPVMSPYFGLKTHLQKIVAPATLLMYSLKGAYLGIVPVSDTVSNFACLVRREEVEKVGSCKDFFNHVIRNYKPLQEIFNQIETDNLVWLEGQAPAFQLKSPPLWPHAYWIGDAVASLHPAIGSGFAHGVSSAVLAAAYYLRDSPAAYRQACQKEVKPKLWIGEFVHQILLNPMIGYLLMPILRTNPWFSGLLQKKIGYT